MLRPRCSAFTILFVAGLLVSCLQATAADQSGFGQMTNGKINQSSEGENALMTALVNQAPEVAAIRFKTGVKTYKFSPGWHVIDDYESPSGTLYIAFEPPLPKGATAGPVPQRVGVLHAGVVVRIQIGVAPLGIGFIGTLWGNPVIQSAPPPNHFAIVGSEARPIPLAMKVDAPTSGTNFLLHDGSICAKGPMGSGPAVFAQRNGQLRALVTRAAFDSALGGHINTDPLSFMCATFDGDDYLNVNGWLIFKVQNGGLKLIAWGRIWAAGPHHILMASESLPSHPRPSYYLEATDLRQ